MHAAFIPRWIIPTVALFFPFSAWADDPPVAQAEIPLGSPDSGKPPPLLLLEVATTSGVAHEYVYDQGRKLSELIWDFKNVVLGGAQLTYRPKPTLRWQVGYWIALNSGSGTLDDYDWTTAPYTQWDMWSHSPVTTDSMSKLDITLTKSLPERLGMQPSIGIGYRQSEMTWSAKGGSYLYSGVAGNLPNIVGITYARKYTLPYLTVAAVWQIDALSLDVGGAYSQWMALEESDTHHLRALKFDGTFSDMSYWDLHLNLSYPLGVDSRLILRATYEDYPNKKGNVRITNFGTGTVGYTPNGSAGANLALWQAGIGYEKRF